MYILLMGQVTIFIQYAAKDQGDDEEKAGKERPLVDPITGAVDRAVLGTFVCSLGKMSAPNRLSCGRGCTYSL